MRRSEHDRVDLGQGDPDGSARQHERSSAGDEHARPDREPKATEADPADERLERLTRDPTDHQRVELRVIARRLEQDRGLLLGEDDAGRAETGGDIGGLRCDLGRLGAGIHPDERINRRRSPVSRS